MVLVRGRTCDCSPKGTQHLRTIKTLQADIVKKAIGHIVSVGLNTRHRRLSQRSTRLPKRFMIGAEGLEPSRARCRAGPWPSCKWRDDGIVPLICPTCQNVFAGIAQSIDASDHHATLHGVVFDILVGSQSRVQTLSASRQLPLRWGEPLCRQGLCVGLHRRSRRQVIWTVWSYGRFS